MPRRGHSAERELLRGLWAVGITAVRVAGSGSSHLYTGDLAVLTPKPAIIEVKETRGTKIKLDYFDTKKLRRLGVDSYLFVKFVTRGWVYTKIDADEVTVTSEDATSLIACVGGFLHELHK